MCLGYKRKNWFDDSQAWRCGTLLTSFLSPTFMKQINPSKYTVYLSYTTWFSSRLATVCSPSIILCVSSFKQKLFSQQVLLK